MNTTYVIAKNGEYKDVHPPFTLAEYKAEQERIKQEKEQERAQKQYEDILLFLGLVLASKG